MIVVRITSFDPSVGQFTADSFSFGVEREIKSRGPKGGTEDINIGVGELQECTITKKVDAASARLAQMSINGNSLGEVEIDFTETPPASSGQGPRTYLRYKLDRAFVKSWSTSGDADDRPTEEVAFVYRRIASAFIPTTGLSVSGDQHVMSWDVTTNVQWLDHGIDLGSERSDD